MTSGPRGSTLTASVSSTSTVQTISVVLRSFDSLTDPCTYLLTQLSDRIRLEVNAPSSSVLACSLLSTSILSNSQREYRWTVTASWTV